jgi:dimeric dUTPase (all-alpha-NTP-PPase superfamily)
MDMLRRMVEVKDEIHPAFGAPSAEEALYLTPAEVAGYMIKHAPHLIKEVTEVQVAAGFEYWKKNRVPDIDGIKEELIDCLHIILSMCVMTGMGPDQIYRLYIEKHERNKTRKDWAGRS